MTLYWDDIVIYSSVTPTTDLVDPNFTGLFTATSNEVGTSITLTGIQGTNANSGVRGAVVLRANGLSQTPPQLNDRVDIPLQAESMVQTLLVHGL